MTTLWEAALGSNTRKQNKCLDVLHSTQLRQFWGVALGSNALGSNPGKQHWEAMLWEAALASNTWKQNSLLGGMCFTNSWSTGRNPYA